MEKLRIARHTKRNFVPMMFDDEILDPEEELDENGLPLIDEEEEALVEDEEDEDAI